MPPERASSLAGSTLRYALAGVLVLFSAWATLHFSVLYAQRRLWLGLLCSVALLFLLAVGVASFVQARRRAGAERAALLSGSGPPGTLLARRVDELSALRERGGRPDLQALSARAAAEVGSRAYLGRYFVTVAVLIGLLGTFAGLMETLTGVSALLKDEAVQTVGAVLALLTTPLSGLDVTFGASMAGILTTVTLSLLQGDLGLCEEEVLAELEAHTAHVLLPRLWPAGEEPAARLLSELGGLRADMAGLVRQIRGWEEASGALFAQALAQGGQQLRASAEEGLRQIAAHAAHTGEALSRQAGQLADQLDTRVRQGNEALAAQARRTAGIIEEMAGRLTEAALLREEARDGQVEALAGRLTEAVSGGVTQTVERAGALLARASAEAAASSREAAAEIARTAGALMSDLEARGQRLTEQLGAAGERVASGALTATQEAAERAASALREAGAQLAEAAAALGRAEAERTRALLEGEARRGADHEALRQRLTEFLDRGVAAPLAACFGAWGEAAQVVGQASAALSSGAEALRLGAAHFAAGSADLAPQLAVLAPELHALSAEVALLAQRGGEEGGGAPPQLLLELMRLSGSIEGLERRLGHASVPEHDIPPIEKTPERPSNAGT